MWLCKRCGNSNGADVLFCTACGTKKGSGRNRVWMIFVIVFMLIITAAVCFSIISSPGKELDRPEVTVGTPSPMVSFPPAPQPADERFDGGELLASFPEDDVYIVGYPSFPGGDIGKAILLYHGDTYQSFDFGWFSRYSIEFAEKLDLDGDGVEEIVFACPSGGGTGLLIESLCVFEPMANGNYSCVTLMADQLQEKVRMLCQAELDWADKILLRSVVTGNIIMDDIPLESNSMGNRMEYSLDGGCLSLQLFPQFYDFSYTGAFEYVHGGVTSISGLEYIDESRLIFPKCLLSADIVYNGHSFELANLEVSKFDSAQ